MQATPGWLGTAAAHFRKVTASYWPGLFHCYDVPDLPRTNNDLERRFGMLRYHERRATGRRSLPGTVVLRGAVRVVPILTADRCDDAPPDLRPSDYAAWWGLRQQLEERGGSAAGRDGSRHARRGAGVGPATPRGRWGVVPRRRATGRWSAPPARAPPHAGPARR